MDDTFERLMMNKSNLQSKFVNNLKNSWLIEQKIEVPDNFHFTVLYKSILLCGMPIIYKVCRQI